MPNKETSLGIDKAGAVTITKDLWSEVQQCLRLMTSVFSQLNNECNEEKDLAMHCNEGPSQRQPCLTRASVRQRLFDDTNSSPALVPKGKIVEKIFIKKKGSSTTSIELASRETFLHNETNKISEIGGLDSACCNQNSCDTSYEDYSLSSPSKPMKDELIRKTLVSETTKGTHAASSGIKASIENSCTKFSADLKSSPVSTVTDKYRAHTSSYDQPALQFSSPKRFDESLISTKKKRRPRYRLVRRRSSLCKTQGRSAEATSEHESDPGVSTKTTASEKGHVARNKHSFDHCHSDREDFHIPEKTMKTNVLHRRPAAGSSPEIDDVILVEAPPKLGRPQAICSGSTTVQCSSMCPSAISRNKTSVTSGSSGGHCHSSTPRKYGEFKETAPSANVARRSGSVETMPSPIKCTSVTETLASTTVMSNSSLLPSSIATESHSECSFSQPDISISSLAKKDIFKRSTSSDNERNTKSNTRSSKDSDVYTERLFLGLPQERVSFSPADDHLPRKGRSKKNEHEIVMLGSDGSSGSTLNRNPEVVSHTKPLLEENYDRTKSRSELCATNKKLLGSKSTSMLEWSDYLPEKESKIISSRKRNRTKHSSEHFTRLSHEHRQSLQLKITPSREKHHPYATSTKFPRIPPSHSPSQSSSIRTPALIPPLQGLSIKSPSSPSHKWSTLDRSPMAMCFKEAQQISDPVVACRTILKFGSDSHSSNKKMSRGEARPRRNKVKKATMRASNITDHRLENNDSRSDCSNGKCLKAFCFNCSMELS